MAGAGDSSLIFVFIRDKVGGTLEHFVIKHDVQIDRYPDLPGRTWALWTALTTLESQLGNGTSFLSVFTHGSQVSIWVEITAASAITAHNKAASLIEVVLDAYSSWPADDGSGWGCAA